MAQKIIILNAPPRCGKDTIAATSRVLYGTETISFKEPMYQIAAVTMGLSLEDFMKLYDTHGWKDTPDPVLNMHTPRDLMIHLSEVYIKPFFGSSYFGDCLVRKTTNFPDHCTFIVPDGGFNSEVEPLLEKFDEVHVFRVRREGFEDFGTDSRSWITLEGPVYKDFDTTEGNSVVVKAIENVLTGSTKCR